MAYSEFDIKIQNTALIVLYVRAALRKAKLPDGYESMSARTNDQLISNGYVANNSYQPDYERVDGRLTPAGERKAKQLGAKSLANVMVRRYKLAKKVDEWKESCGVPAQNALNHLLPNFKISLMIMSYSQELYFEIHGKYAHYMMYRTDEGCYMSSRDCVIRSDEDLTSAIVEQTEIWQLNIGLEHLYQDMLKFIGVVEL